MEKNNNLMSGKGEKGKWITINGSHIFVEDGQSVEDAMNKQFSKKDDGKRQVLWNGNMKREDITPEYIRSLSDADCLRLLKWLNS